MKHDQLVCGAKGLTQNAVLVGILNISEDVICLVPYILNHYESHPRRVITTQDLNLLLQEVENDATSSPLLKKTPEDERLESPKMMAREKHGNCWYLCEISSSVMIFMIFQALVDPSYPPPRSPSKKQLFTPLKINGWNIIMEVWKDHVHF